MLSIVSNCAKRSRVFPAGVGEHLWAGQHSVVCLQFVAQPEKLPVEIVVIEVWLTKKTNFNPQNAKVNKLLKYIINEKIILKNNFKKNNLNLF